MEHDQESEVVSPDVILRILKEMADGVETALIANGTDPDIARGFTCLRFHVTHPWGIATVLVDDKIRTAIVRRNPDNNDVQIFAIITMPGDRIKAVNGVEVSDDGCLPLSSFAVENTRH